MIASFPGSAENVTVSVFAVTTADRTDTLFVPSFTNCTNAKSVDNAPVTVIASAAAHPTVVG